MATITYKDIGTKLDTILEKLTIVERCQAVERERVEALIRLVEKHERILFGDNGEGGIIQTVNSIMKTQATLIKALWILLTPLLASIGIGVVWLITNAPQ